MQRAGSRPKGIIAAGKPFIIEVKKQNEHKNKKTQSPREE
jgi:hypothetical protein